MHVGSDDDDMDLDEPEDSSGAGVVDPFDFVYSSLPDSTHILEQVPDCEHCYAKKFEHETPGFCCRNRQIELAEPVPTLDLKRLWYSMDAECRHFRESIRFFNGHFSFTTLEIGRASCRERVCLYV